MTESQFQPPPLKTTRELRPEIHTESKAHDWPRYRLKEMPFSTVIWVEPRESTLAPAMGESFFISPGGEEVCHD